MSPIGPRAAVRPPSRAVPSRGSSNPKAGHIVLKQALVWMDNKEARLFRLHPDSDDRELVLAPLHSIHRNHQDVPGRPKEHPADAKRYYVDICRALDDIDEILVVGPSTAKFHFVKHVHEHDHVTGPKLVGVETVDHPSDAQLVSYARQYFTAPRDTVTA